MGGEELCSPPGIKAVPLTARAGASLKATASFNPLLLSSTQPIAGCQADFLEHPETVVNRSDTAPAFKGLMGQ